MTPADLQRQIDLLQQQYTKYENEFLRLKPRVKHLTRTLAQLDGAIMVLRSLLPGDPTAAQEPVLGTHGLVSTPGS